METSKKEQEQAKLRAELERTKEIREKQKIILRHLLRLKYYQDEASLDFLQTNAEEVARLLSRKGQREYQLDRERNKGKKCEKF